MSELGPRAQDILQFWFTEIETKRWFNSDPEFDALLRERFQKIHALGAKGGLDSWVEQAPSALALVILLDQMSRNMYRGTEQAFAQDAKALELAEAAISAGHDMATDATARAFFYMPHMHSEDIAMQDRCVELITERLGEGSTNLPHAIWHRDVIARFGRFPFRNKALARESTEEETAFLEQENVPD